MRKACTSLAKLVRGKPFTIEEVCALADPELWTARLGALVEAERVRYASDIGLILDENVSQSPLGLRERVSTLRVQPYTLLPLKGGEPDFAKECFALLLEKTQGKHTFTYQAASKWFSKVEFLAGCLWTLREASLLVTRNELEGQRPRKPYDPGPRLGMHYGPSVVAAAKNWSDAGRPLPVGASQVHPEDGRVTSFKLAKKLGPH